MTFIATIGKVLLKLAAGIGLMFFFYSYVQIVRGWQYRNTVEKVLWSITIAVGGGVCIAVIFR